MKQGTTTTFKVKQFDLPDITEIIFSFTNDKNNVVVERTTPTTDDGQIHKSYPSEVSLEDGYYKIGLDQDETLQLNETFYVEAQIMFSGAVTKAYIDKVRMPHTFYTKVISGATTNGEEIELTMELSDVIEIEGGGSSNYNDLTNKPRINNTELIGNKTDTDLGLATKTELNAKQNVIIGGNGIDVSSDVVSVAIIQGSYLGFENGKLFFYSESLGHNKSFRQYLVDTAYQNPLASKSYVDNLMSGAVKRLVVQTLPTQDIDTNTIYMVLKSAPTTNNIYDEYMYINNAWELIGSTEVDLSNYYTKTESDNRYNAKLTVGNGIDITNGVISAKIVSSGNILKFSGGELVVLGSDIVNDSSFKNAMPYDTTIRQALTTGSNSPLQPKLTAGTNITIDANNVISASGGGLSYTFTDGLSESSGTVGIDLASGSKLLIDANDKLDVDLSSKQDTIDTTHKLSSDLVTDTSATNKFVPTHSSSESGKVLGVDTNGDLEWTTKGSGGTSDYTDLQNKPQINSTTLSGNKTSHDLGLQAETTISTDTSSTTVSLTLADNHEYRYTQDLTSLTLTMPSGDFIASIVFASGSTPTSMTYDSNIKWSGDDVTNGQFVPTEKTYNIVMWYDGINVNGVVRGV